MGAEYEVTNVDAEVGAHADAPAKPQPKNEAVLENRNAIEKYFDFAGHKTNLATEARAGVTTFLTMAYILIVQPLMLSEAGMDFKALFTGTALASMIPTLLMGVLAKLPLALAPGMGLNAFMVYGVVFGMGRSWQFAITCVFVEGIIFLLLTALNIREQLVKAIPQHIKEAMAVGVGLFITFIGLQNGKIIIDDPATLTAQGKINTGDLAPEFQVTFVGLLVTSVLLAYKVKGALMIGIIVATIFGAFPGIEVTQGIAEDATFAPQDISPIAFKFEFDQLFTGDGMTVLFTMLLVDMFDTIGTLVGVCMQAELLEADGGIPNAKKALFTDAFGTALGACLGQSPVTCYIESAAGVEDGGRTGFTSVVTAFCFFISLFLAPLFLMIPGAATAPALIIVGLFMMKPVKKLDLEDPTEAIPAFVALIMMPLSFSIAAGLQWGIPLWVILKVATKRWAEVPLATYPAAIFLGAKFFY
jgi:AGZA family xanthine/uracil permease-like MFS transporter